MGITVAISTAAPSYKAYQHEIPEEAEEKTPLPGDGEKLQCHVIVKVGLVRCTKCLDFSHEY